MWTDGSGGLMFIAACQKLQTTPHNHKLNICGKTTRGSAWFHRFNFPCKGAHCASGWWMSALQRCKVTEKNNCQHQCSQNWKNHPQAVPSSPDFLFQQTNSANAVQNLLWLFGWSIHECLCHQHTQVRCIDVFISVASPWISDVTFETIIWSQKTTWRGFKVHPVTSPVGYLG